MNREIFAPNALKGLLSRYHRHGKIDVCDRCHVERGAVRVWNSSTTNPVATTRRFPRVTQTVRRHGFAQTLPPLDPPKPNRERVREVKRRSKAERLQRRKKRKQRSKG